MASIRLSFFQCIFLQLFFIAGINAQSLKLLKTTYPKTERQIIFDELHGVQVPDPYRWLENIKDEKVQKWIKAQDQLTRQYIEPLEIRQKIRQKMEEVAPKRVYYDAPVKRGDDFIFQKSWREGDLIQSAIFRQKGIDGKPQILINAKDFGEEARFAAYSGSGAASFQVSDQGNYLAFGIRLGNEKWIKWYIYHLKKEQLLKEVIEGIDVRANGNTVSWMPDESGFFYGAYERTTDGNAPFQLSNQKLFFHRLNTSQREDKMIYENPENPNWQFWGKVSADNQHLLIHVYETWLIGTFYKNLQEKENPFIPLLEGENLRFTFLKSEDKQLYFFTTEGAPQGHIIKIDTRKPLKENWQIVLPEKQEVNLVTAKVIGGQFLCHYTKDAIPLVQTYDFQGNFLRQIDLPYIGWLRSGFIGTSEDSLFSFNIQNSADPGSTFLVNVHTGESALFFQQSQNYDHDEYITKQIFYPSKDGVKIPMFLMYKKGIKLDGNRPTWLYAYGSNWAAAPWYQIQHRIWMEMGGVYALANVRGGSEYGEAWKEAGLGLNRQTGIDDFIAAGEWLIENDYTSKKRLAVNGGSASAPLAGAALNQRPELFGAAIISYGNADLIRYLKFGGTMPTIHGDPAEEAMFKVLIKWSPYHNVKEDTCYPPVFIAHGDEDQLTPTINSYKLAAALQYAQGCDAPVFLQIAWGRGHTVGGMEERANQLTFLAQVMEIELVKEW